LAAFYRHGKKAACARRRNTLPAAGKKEAPAGPEAFIFPAAAGDIYFVCADRRGLIKRKKRKAQGKAIFTIPPASAGGIYLSPAAAGDIYFVRADRPGIIKVKKERPRRKAIFIHPTPARGWDN